MKKSLVTFCLIIILLFVTIPVCGVTAESDLDMGAKVHYFGEFDLTNHSQLSNYEKAISNMLQMGWAMNEINDLPREKVLEYAAAQSSTRSSQYLCYSIDELNQEHVVEMKKDEFDYCVNREKRKFQNGNDVTKLSSSGKLMISNIWSTASDTNQYNSTGYLKQDQYLTWMGNNTFSNSYRWEWVIQPENTKKDVFYLMHQSNTTMVQDSEYYIYKYDYTRNNDTVVVKTYESTTPVTYKYENTSGVAYTVDLKDAEEYLASDGYCYHRYTNHRGYMSYSTVINNSSAVATSAAGGYLHCKWAWVVSPGVSLDGLSISISPSYAYEEETPGTYCSTKK